MSKLKITAFVSDGEEREIAIKSGAPFAGLSHLGIQSIDLSPLSEHPNLSMVLLTGNRLTSIDLSPLESCEQLRTINLGFNSLSEIDLTPLANVRSLEFLDLGVNTLKEIDLSPLNNLSNIQALRIDNNQLTEIDLAPMVYAHKLRLLDLSSNRLKKIDLWPLALCNNLEKLIIEKNELGRIDVTPVSLIGTARRIFKDLETRISIHPSIDILFQDTESEFEKIDSGSKSLLTEAFWNKSFDILANLRSNDFSSSNWIPMQKLLLQLFSMPELGIYDGPLDDILSAIPSTASVDEARHLLYDRMIVLLENQIEKDGSTLFMDVDAMATTKASKLIHNVIEQRKKEIERARVKILDDRVDISSLWVTSYGNAILSTLGISSMTVTNSQLDAIKKAMKQSGLKMITTTKPPSKDNSPKMSEELKSYVFDVLLDNQQPGVSCGRRIVEIQTVAGILRDCDDAQHGRTLRAMKQLQSLTTAS
ncbi:MAG: hypothetical protein RTU30_04465 [Candidatus Thorarchaeota archaeon]